MTFLKLTLVFSHLLSSSQSGKKMRTGKEKKRIVSRSKVDEAEKWKLVFYRFSIIDVPCSSYSCFEIQS